MAGQGQWNWLPYAMMPVQVSRGIGKMVDELSNIVRTTFPFRPVPLLTAVRAIVMRGFVWERVELTCVCELYEGITEALYSN